MGDPPDRGQNNKPPITMDIKRSLTILSPGPKYLIMKRVNSDKTLSEVSPFLIKKVIDGTCGGEVEACRKLLNGTILIKTKNFVQARTLIRLTSLTESIEVELSEHKTLNYIKGVIYSNDLRGIPEDEILAELKKQNVHQINKILRKVDNELKETGLIIVTFASTTLPPELFIGYEKVKIRPYIPLPLKCKNCLHYGHLSKFCNNNKICFNCSMNYHLNDEIKETCSHTPLCINCKENNIENNKHPANDKSCPIFLKEKEIQAIITLEKTNRKTAIKKYNDRHPSAQSSYSSVTRNNNNQSLNQTQQQPSTSQQPQIQPSTACQAKLNSENSSHVKPNINTMPPPKTIATTHENNNSDAMSFEETSDNDSTSSQNNNTDGINSLKIVPLNTSKRTRKQLLKTVKENTKRTKKA